MARTLYVGNLPWHAKSEDLTSFFSDYGQVLGSRIIVDRETGRSRGFGFVKVNDGDAERMINTLNGTEFQGRTLTVNEARPRI